MYNYGIQCLNKINLWTINKQIIDIKMWIELASNIYMRMNPLNIVLRN